MKNANTPVIDMSPSLFAIMFSDQLDIIASSDIRLIFSGFSIVSFIPGSAFNSPISDIIFFVCAI